MNNFVCVCKIYAIKKYKVMKVTLNITKKYETILKVSELYKTSLNAYEEQISMI